MVAMITNNGSQWCTGFLIGPDTLITAGHCVHPGGAGSTWYPPTALRVYPAYNPSSANPTPFGSCGVTSTMAPAGWTTSADDQYDYGAMKLDCTVGNQTGWFGWWWQPTSLDGQLSKIIGYPGDKAGAAVEEQGLRPLHGRPAALLRQRHRRREQRVTRVPDPRRERADVRRPLRHGRPRLRHLRQLPVRLVQPRHARHPRGLRQLLPLAQQLTCLWLGMAFAALGRASLRLRRWRFLGACRSSPQLPSPRHVARRARRLVRTSGHSAARIEYIAVSRAPGWSAAGW